MKIGLIYDTILLVLFKSYYYDSDTGWCRLSSRYYDATVGRFINADDLAVLEIDQNNQLENNLYAYCLNNPVNHYDLEGYYAASLANPQLGVAFLASAILLAIAAYSQAAVQSINIYFAKKKVTPYKPPRKGSKTRGQKGGWERNVKPDGGEEHSRVDKAIKGFKEGFRLGKSR